MTQSVVTWPGQKLPPSSYTIHTVLADLNPCHVQN